jgi:predicted Zn-dependent protease with MMP-like domain
MKISDEKFEQFVVEALDSLPEKYQKWMHNVAVFVEERPSKEQLSKAEKKQGFVLFGIFEGYGQSSKMNFGPVLPDRITIFKGSICGSFDSEEEIKAQVLSTLKHEIAHHFGSDEKGAKKAQKN